MNERIKELAVQVGIPSLWTVGTDKQGNPILEKFAELIVRDVVKTIKRTQNTSPDFEWVILNNYHLEIEE